MRAWFAAPQSKTTAHATPVELEDSIFRLDDGWWGLHASSPNRRWVISWRDGHWTESTRGKRRFESGAYLLYDTRAGAVLLEGVSRRPNNGGVSDDGTFILEDWGDPSELASSLMAFAASGSPLLDAHFTANVMFSAISPKGRYAVAQMANSSSQDSGQLMLFDLRKGVRLYSVVSAAGWPDRYSVDDNTGEVTAHLREFGEFRYAPNGVFREAERLEQVKLDRGDARDIGWVVEAMLHEPALSQVRAERAVAGLARVLAKGPWDDPREQARALKRLGQLEERLDHPGRAIGAYAEAYALDAKVGVKRRLEALRKQ
jgi:hypothetical protein